jgi:hypothetical protein
MKKQYESDKKSKERRATERRMAERRGTAEKNSGSGSNDKRVSKTDRRVTIINREKKEVSDRRSE